MADVNIVIAAQDMASNVMKGVASQTKVLSTSVQSMSSGVVASTRAMSAGFTSLTASILPLAAVLVSVQALMAVFTFMRDSVLAFVEAGSPMGVQLGQSLAVAQEAIHQLMIAVGGLLAPLVQVGAEGITVLATTITAIMQPAIQWMTGAFESMRPMIDMFLQGIIAAATGAEVAFTNMGDVVQLAWLSFKLGFAQMIEGTKHTFTVVLPAYIQWFGENAYNLLRDAAVGMVTVLTNFGKNLGEFGAAIYMWVSGGMKGGLDGLMNQLGQTMMVSLTDGFEAQTQALPDIAARQITDYEKQLMGEMGVVGANLANEFNAKFQERAGGIKDTLTFKGEPAAEAPAEKLGASLAAVADSQSTIAQQLNASESRLLTRGPSEGPMQSVAQTSQKTAIAAEKTQEASDRMVDLLEQLLARNFIVAEAV